MREKSRWQAEDGISVTGLLPGSLEQKRGSGSRGALGSEQLTRQISLSEDDEISENILLLVNFAFI